MHDMYIIHTEDTPKEYAKGRRGEGERGKEEEMSRIGEGRRGE
jgi:hypothetical protein